MSYIGNQNYTIVQNTIGDVKGTDTEANILLKTPIEGDLWVASDTSNKWLANGATWSNLGPLRGPQGVQGEIGPHGTQGIQGIQGLQGVQGETGSQGIQGEVGPQGIQGVQGLTGDSAYEVAVANGFVGNEVAWLASLVGPQGAQGLKGDQGVQGNPGTSVTSVTSSRVGDVTTITVYVDGIVANTFTINDGADGLGAGDMVKSIYDPTGVNASVFDVDNHVSGTTNKVYTATEQTKLSGIAAGAQVNDANTTLQGNTFNGVSQLVKLDGTGKLPAIDGSQLTNMPVALPSQTGYAGKYLKTDGTNATWEEVASAGSAAPINKPIITSPTTGAIGFIGEVQTDAYSTADTYQGAQDYAIWQ